MCERWLAYENFLADMGRRPSASHSLEREDNGGDYCPGNCVWATKKTQAANRRSNIRVEYKGQTMILKDASEAAGLPYKTVHARIKNGWDAAAALSTPIANRGQAQR